MKSLIRYSHGRMTYTGRIPRPSFRAWTESPDARPILDAVAAHTRLSLLGKTRAARRRVWRQLNQAAQADGVLIGVQSEVDEYLTRMDRLAHADGLPCVGLHLRRLVLVPRVFLNAESYGRIDAILRAQPVFSSLESGHLLRTWFSVTVVESIAGAVAGAQPSPQRPAPAGEEWMTVGVNERFQWRVALEGPAWPGHYYVLELTRAPVTRALRKEAAEAIARLESTVASLSRSARQEILSRAASSLPHLFAPA